MPKTTVKCECTNTIEGEQKAEAYKVKCGSCGKHVTVEALPKPEPIKTGVRYGK